MDEQLLTHVGDYEVLGVLGIGGMGKVYKVRNVITDRVEAMKILLPDLAHQRALAERFLREIKLLAGLNHPNIAPLHTALTWNNQLVMVMEYVEGVTLAVRIKDGPMSAEEAIDYISQVLSALSYAHGKHIVHRDIKPANMMLTPEGVVKLMDFGIARAESDPVLTATGSTLGSLQYMSPEQVKGEPADERSDIYSTGISLYEMVTGQRPFQADNEYAVMAAHLQKQPTPPINLRADLPAGLSEIILKAMAKDPSVRFQSAAEFIAALRTISQGKSEPRAAVPLPTVPGVDVTGTLATPPTAAVRAAMRGAAAEKTPVLAALGGAPSASAVPGTRSGPTGASEVNAAAPSEARPQTGNVQQPPAMVQSPVGANLPAQLPPGGNTHRGLYVALGSVIVLVVLVIAGISIPRLSRTHAGGDAGTFAEPVSSKPAPATNAPQKSEIDGAKGSISGENSTAAVPEPPPIPPKPGSESTRAGGSERSVPSQAGVGDAHRGRRAAATQPSQAATETQQREQRAAAGPGPIVGNVAGTSANAGRLQEVDHDLDLLSSRAEAVDSSLEGLRQNQAAQGLGLRGDIAGSQQRMRTYIGKAQSALRDQDAEQAKKYLDLAEGEVAKLEKFLGR